MRAFRPLVALLLAAALLASCHHAGSDSPPPSAPPSFSVSATAIGLDRTADQQALPVGGLPAAGAQITVQ
jgi:hypothetical protein